MKKSIYIFRQYASPSLLPGGTRHFNLAKELVRNGITVIIFASNYNHLTKKDVREFNGKFMVESIEGVKFVWIKTFHYYRNDWRRLVNMLDYAFASYRISLKLRNEYEKPDVIMGSIAHIFAVMAAFIASKRLGSRFFIDIGDLWPEAFVLSEKLSRRSPIYILMKKLMIFYYQRAEKIICITQTMMEYFEELGLREKTLLLPPGIKLDQQIINDEEMKSPASNIVIYSGSFQPLYPLDTVLRAASMIKKEGKLKVKFILIGDGLQKRKLMELSERLQLDNVIFKEPMTKQELLEYLPKATAFIMIEKNIQFGFSNKLIDYLLIGRPIIYASSVPNDKLFKTGISIRAKHDDPKSIVDAVETIVCMPEHIKKRIQIKARDFITENYDINKITAKLLEVLDKDDQPN